MSAAQACLKLAAELPVSLVQSLIVQLRAGVPPRLSNPSYQARVDEFLRRASEPPGELAARLDMLLAARSAAPAVELVWTGPPVAAVPVRQTEQVLLDLIQCAQHKLTIASFGVFQIPRLVQALEQALCRGVVVRVVLGERESPGVGALDRQRQQLGLRISGQAAIYQWPEQRRSRDDEGRPGLMHMKLAAADSTSAFLTSANLTSSALERNIELGVLIRGGDVPAAVERLVDALIESGELTSAETRCP